MENQEIEIINPDRESTIKTYLQTVKMESESLTIADDITLAKAINIRGGVKKAYKKIEDERKEWVKPLKEAAKRGDEKFKKLSEPFKQLDELLKGKIESYYSEQLRKQREAELAAEVARREELRLLEEKRKEEEAKAKSEQEKTTINIKAEMAKEDLQSKPVMVEEVKTKVETPHAKMNIRKIWAFEIEDKEKVPDNYWIVDESAIRAAVSGGAREIPGIRIYQKVISAQ